MEGSWKVPQDTTWAVMQYLLTNDKVNHKKNDYYCLFKFQMGCFVSISGTTTTGDFMVINAKLWMWKQSRKEPPVNTLTNTCTNAQRLDLSVWMSSNTSWSLWLSACLRAMTHDGNLKLIRCGDWLTVLGAISPWPLRLSLARFCNPAGQCIWAMAS